MFVESFMHVNNIGDQRKTHVISPLPIQLLLSFSFGEREQLSVTITHF